MEELHRRRSMLSLLDQPLDRVDDLRIGKRGDITSVLAI
jgi:hypothetical protein